MIEIIDYCQKYLVSNIGSDDFFCWERIGNKRLQITPSVFSTWYILVYGNLDFGLDTKMLALVISQQTQKSLLWHMLHSISRASHCLSGVVVRYSIRQDYIDIIQLCKFTNWIYLNFVFSICKTQWQLRLNLGSPPQKNLKKDFGEKVLCRRRLQKTSMREWGEWNKERETSSRACHKQRELNSQDFWGAGEAS